MNEPSQPELLAAIEAHRRGDRPRAKEILSSFVQRSPGHHEAIFMLGCVTAEMGDLPSGEAALRRALELSPDEPQYLGRLARMLLRQRRPIEAAEAIQRVIDSGHAGATQFVELGNIRLIARQFELAESAFRRAIELDGSNTFAGSGLVLALTGLERQDDALAEARRFAERCPDTAEAHARLAMLLERLNRLDEARGPAERGVAIDPQFGLAQLALGTVQLRLGEHDAARASLERALTGARDPLDRQAILLALGQALDALGRCDEAFARFAEAKQIGANLSPASRQMGDEFLRFIESSRRTIDTWAVASWGPGPDYRAFSTPPIFIAGFPRSGIALCERMLGAQGKFISTNEYPVMGKLREHLQRHAGGIENVPAYLGQIGEAEIRLLRAIYFGEVERILAGQDPIGKRLIDRHPINIAHLSIVRRIFPDAPVIVCLRDPRDAVLSAFMRIARSPTAGAYFATIEAAAGYYAALMGLWLHFRQVLELNCIEVRYERLVSEPEAESRRVLGLLKEQENPVASSLIKGMTDDVDRRGIGRWRRYRGHFGPALQTLAPFVEAFGYDAE